MSNHIKIDTQDFKNIPDIIAAGLSESIQDAATLSLEFKGVLPEGYDYMTPITVMHRGKVLFHGKVTQAQTNISATETTSTVEAQNFIWLWERQAFSPQLATLAASPRDEEGVIRVDGAAVDHPQFASTEDWLDAFSLYADGWTVSEEGELLSESQLWVAQVDEGTTSWLQPRVTQNKLYTAWQAMLRVKDRNASAAYIPDYHKGTLQLRNTAHAASLEWDTAVIPIMSADGVAPNYDKHITGVVLCVTSESSTYTAAYVYPPDIDILQEGVQVFEVEGAWHMSTLWKLEAQAYYERANALIWEGSLTLLNDYLDVSPLGYAINVTGQSIPKAWGAMNAYARAVDWDFLSDEVSIELGRDLSEPEFSSMSIETAESEEDTTTTMTAGDGGGDPPPPDDVTTTEEGTMPPIFPTFGDTGSGSVGSLGSFGTVGTQGSTGTSGSVAKDCWTEEELLAMIHNQIKYTRVEMITGSYFLHPPTVYPEKWDTPQHPAD